MRALAVSPTAPPNKETLARLVDLHPPLLRPLPAWIDTYTPLQPFTLTEDVLHSALATAPREAAGGPSGWVFEHVRDAFLASGTLFKSFAAVCSTMAAGNISAPVADLLGPSRLEAFSKDPTGVL